jgi:RHS repeat-associated protein
VHGNHLGAPLVTTDASGNTATTPNDYLAPGFPGQSRTLADLYYNRYRDYDPTIGRYIQADPIGLDGGQNSYVYAANNPVGWMDPWGLAVCTFSLSKGSIKCTPDSPNHTPVNVPAASGNNGGGMKCRNNVNCTGIPNHGPIPLGCWRWAGRGTQKPNGRVLEPCPGTPTNQKEDRRLIRSHSCVEPFGPGLGPKFCSEGCVTGYPNDIKRLNGLIDLEPGSILKVVP